MIYLASPYSSPDPIITKTRFLLAEECVATLIKQGHHIWSPIVHCHEMARRFDLPTDAQFWKEYNFDFIRRCEALFCLQIEGWMESKGVMMELKLAGEILLPVRFVNVEGLFIEP
jgi:chromosome condensin MukBEF MukE localization factor